jgi:phenylacetaldehyde dehydrogenase
LTGFHTSGLDRRAFALTRTMFSRRQRRRRPLKLSHAIAANRGSRAPSPRRYHRRPNQSDEEKVTLELGGKSPNVVYADADLARAIPGSASAIFFNAGEVCVAGSRLYIEQPIFDEFVAGLSDEAKKIKVGNGLEPDTTMGPLVSSEQLDRVTGYIESGRSDGATVAIGGSRIGGRGYFVEPTILTGTSPAMKVESEEIFGPVVSAIPFSDPAELAAQANGTSYGLGAGVFTSDVRKAYTTARKLRAGTVWVNTWHMLNAAVPFGGYKQSGWGREMGHEALEGYLETKSVITDLG